MKKDKVILLSAVGLMAYASLQAQTIGSYPKIDLSGQWAFAQGDKPEYSDQVMLPGSMLTNGKGDDVCTHTQWTGSLYDSSFYFNPYMEKYRQEEILATGKHRVKGTMKFPFFLTPEKHYIGNAWYRKTIFVPKDWKKQRVILYLERPHIETSVFINGKLAGRDSSLSVPHEFDVTPYMIYGKDNEIAIKVYNGIENVCVGQDSHSVTDQTQGNWNGIVGRMELQARQQRYIRNLQVYPDVKEKQIKVVMDVTGDINQAKFSFDISGVGRSEIKLNRGADGKFSVVLPMGEDVKLWDEFNPNLYELTAVMGKDSLHTTFGMSEISIKDKQFYMNGKKIWMRGTVGNCCFPETGYPPTDEASWLRIFKKCKEYGLNMMRFHSYCPPEAAFSAADKVGMYLQPEGPSWPNHGVKLGNGMSIDHYLMQETQRMVEKYGNHPSFCMLAAGNEPAGNWVKWVGDFVEQWKQTGDKRRVYCGASVGGGWAWDPKSEYHVKGGARGLDWDKKAPQSEDNFDGDMLKVVQKGRTPITFDVDAPRLTHEMGQWCAFPDLKEVSQYTGAYKARNFEIFSDLLRDNGMASQAEKFLHASGKLQTLAYKYDLERNLRTKDYAGFQLLGLNDYSGQGTALVGVLNVHWKEKGYCDAQDWTEFCSPIVPLAKFPKFVFAGEEKVQIPVELYNAYKEPLEDARVKYAVQDEMGNVMSAGELTDFIHCAKEQQDGSDDQRLIPVGKNINLGRVPIDMRTLQKPAKYRLIVSVWASNAKTIQEVLGANVATQHLPQAVTNQWDFWVYPSEIEMPKVKDIYITDSLDAKAKKVLQKGGKVLLLAAGKVKMGEDVKQTYLPVFWNTSWFKMRPPHPTGATIDKGHPLFKNFPTDDWTNLNWWELLNKAQVMNLREFPKNYQPAIQPIDTWHVSRKLGMMVEAKVGKGKLLMTTMDVSNDLEHRRVASQMRYAILKYMMSADFQPTMDLDMQVIEDLFTKSAPAVNMFTKDSPDELKPKLK